MFTKLGKKSKTLPAGRRETSLKRFHQNPFFYFGLTSFVLLGLLFVSSDSLAENHYSKPVSVVFSSNTFLNESDAITDNDLFFSQNKELALQTPDLHIAGDSIRAVATPSVLTTQTLGDIFGGSDDLRREEKDYNVVVGDTPSLIIKKFNINMKTLLWANPDIRENSALKVGQSLVIPRADGVLYIVKSGDTIGDIAKTYKSTIEKIVAANNLKNEGDIFVEDVLFLPDAQMPQKPAPIVQIPLADTFGMIPAEGHISQWRHGLLGRGIDIANKCGTPIHAAAAGVVQRASFSAAYGNFITISHSNGAVTYYGHEQALMVKPGDRVSMGQVIGLMGRTGYMATGCHVHFEVRGANNFMAKYPLGSNVRFK